MEDRFEKAKNNYIELEGKINTILSRCSDSTKTESFNDLTTIPEGLRRKGIKNCNLVESYNIEGLSVYRLLNNNEPIEFLISSKPLFVKQIINDSNGRRTIQYARSDYSFLEYSKGGFNNSITIKLATGDKYTIPKFIGLCHSGNDLIPDVRVCEGGSSLKVEGASGVGDYVKYVLSSSNRDTISSYNTGDLFGYVRHINPDRHDKVIVDQYRSIVNGIDAVALKLQKEDLNNKKSIINILFKGKDNNSNNDPFKLILKK